MLGLDFYGRCFKLTDCSCSQAHCVFSGGARANAPLFRVYFLLQRVVAPCRRTTPVRVTMRKRLSSGSHGTRISELANYDDEDIFIRKQNTHALLAFPGPCFRLLIRTFSAKRTESIWALRFSSTRQATRQAKSKMCNAILTLVIVAMSLSAAKHARPGISRLRDEKRDRQARAWKQL
jgi:hypothetical protein